MKKKAKTQARNALIAVKKEERRIEKPLKAVEKLESPRPKGAPKSASAGKLIAETLGGLLPPPFNALASPILGKLGSFVGDKVGTFFGAGDYESNSLIDMVAGKKESPKMAPGVPYVHSQGGEIRLCFREDLGPIYASDIAGDTKFYRFRVHACESDTFPFLSQIARLFQNWRPNGMIFQFESQTGPIADIPNLGVVSMAMEYDAGKPEPFNSIQQMDNSYGGFARKTTEDLAFGVECALGKNVLETLYCRNDPSSPDVHDPQFYDLGTFVIAAQGQPVTNQEIGRLWVSYDISLSKALLDRDFVGSPRMAAWYMNMTTVATTGKLFLLDSAALLTPAAANVAANNFTKLSLDCPSWLDPLDYVAGTFLHFPELTTGVYKLDISMGLFASTASLNAVPEVVLADRCDIGPLTITNTEGTTNLLTGGDSLNPAPECFATPQVSLTSNLMSCTFTFKVIKERPTIAFWGIGTRQASWTVISLSSIPIAFSPFAEAPLLAAWKGVSQKYPRPDVLSTDTQLVHERDYSGRKLGWVQKPTKTLRCQEASTITVTSQTSLSEKGSIVQGGIKSVC